MGCGRTLFSVHVKQLGSAHGRDHHDITTFPADLQVRDYPETAP